MQRVSSLARESRNAHSGGDEDTLSSEDDELEQCLEPEPVSSYEGTASHATAMAVETGADNVADVGAATPPGVAGGGASAAEPCEPQGPEASTGSDRKGDQSGTQPGKPISWPDGPQTAQGPGDSVDREEAEPRDAECPSPYLVIITSQYAWESRFLSESLTKFLSQFGANNVELREMAKNMKIAESKLQHRFKKKDLSYTPFCLVGVSGYGGQVAWHTATQRTQAAELRVVIYRDEDLGVWCPVAVHEKVVSEAKLAVTKSSDKDGRVSPARDDGAAATQSCLRTR